MRISDWSSDVCSSDLKAKAALEAVYGWLDEQLAEGGWATPHGFTLADCAAAPSLFYADWVHRIAPRYANLSAYRSRLLAHPSRSEEHTSELQSLMRISYAVFCLKKKHIKQIHTI